MRLPIFANVLECSGSSRLFSSSSRSSRLFANVPDLPEHDRLEGTPGEPRGHTWPSQLKPLLHLTTTDGELRAREGTGLPLSAESVKPRCRASRVGFQSLWFQSHGSICPSHRFQSPRGCNPSAVMLKCPSGYRLHVARGAKPRYPPFFCPSCRSGAGSPGFLAARRTPSQPRHAAALPACLESATEFTPAPHSQSVRHRRVSGVG